MSYPITANIVTGFLGSGKTTLMKYVLKHGLEKERVAVIVNEVSDLGIDGQVVQGMNVDKMIEVNSGCICCSGILQLGLALQEIIETVNPTTLLIESSGVAEAAPLVSELRSVGLRTDALITVVDAENILRLIEESHVAKEQIENADFLILNKKDLVAPIHLDAIEKYLLKLNGRAPIFKTHHGAIDTHLLFACSPRRYREQAAAGLPVKHSHAAEDGYESFTYNESGSLKRDLFDDFLKKLPHGIYRAKGIVHFEEEAQPSLFNYVCGRYSIDWINLNVANPFTNQAVFIGRKINEHMDRIIYSLRLCGKK